MRIQVEDNVPAPVIRGSRIAGLNSRSATILPWLAGDLWAQWGSSHGTVLYFPAHSTVGRTHSSRGL
jgi:hypothetical protein